MLSLAFSILKVARMDEKVNHNCSDSVTSAHREYDEYQPLHLQHAFQHKLYIIVKRIYIGLGRRLPLPKSIS